MALGNVFPSQPDDHSRSCSDSVCLFKQWLTFSDNPSALTATRDSKTVAILWPCFPGRGVARRERPFQLTGITDTNRHIMG
jgi:hypothetical protein